MKNRILLLLLSLFIYQNADAARGDIIEFTLLSSQNAAELGQEVTDFTGFPASVLGIQYDVDLYFVKYETLDYDMISSTEATGVVAIPSNFLCDLPMVTYGHGLTLKNNASPSSLNSAYDFIARGIASNGYIVMALDYIHLGEDASPGYQAFMHADTEAAATIDIIRATRTYCEQNGINYTEQLFISGYSEGGHSSMATCREIQENYSDEFQITAAEPGGGTYDLSGIAADSLASNTRTTGEPHAFPLVAKTYMLLYQDSLAAWDMDFTFDDVFKSPYDSLLNHILDQDDPFGDVSGLSNIPVLMLEDTFKTEFQTNPDFVMRTFLSYNDLYDWVPQMKMRIFHSTADVENPYENVLFTYNLMTSMGAPDLDLQTVDDISHPDAGLFHVLDFRTYFNSLKAECTVSTQDNELDCNINISPNPSDADMRVSFGDCSTEIVSIEIYNINGQKMYTQNSPSSTMTISKDNFKAQGSYLLFVTGKDGRTKIEGFVRK
jgi:hypothetical protein